MLVVDGSWAVCVCESHRQLVGRSSPAVPTAVHDKLMIISCRHARVPICIMQDTQYTNPFQRLILLS
jgi:hypothetical protein